MAEALREGRPVEPEAYDCVTIFFSDVPDFQNICTKLDPLEVRPACFWAVAGFCPLSKPSVCEVPCGALRVDCEAYAGPSLRVAMPLRAPTLAGVPWWPALAACLWAVQG